MEQVPLDITELGQTKPLLELIMSSRGINAICFSHQQQSDLLNFGGWLWCGAAVLGAHVLHIDQGFVF